MDKSFTEFRQAIFATKAEMKRFYQLVVNAVIATDIFDPELKASRNERWQLAFSSSSSHVAVPGSTPKTLQDYKATIVIEHLMQASDVVHTMQHWHVYRKWNQRLFVEMYRAHQAGRLSHDPTAHWYDGEIQFLENYVIPLARKLGDCGVFGVSGDEYLSTYASQHLAWQFCL